MFLIVCCLCLSTTHAAIVDDGVIHTIDTTLLNELFELYDGPTGDSTIFNIMSGGETQEISLHETSIINVYDGFTRGLTTYDSSVINSYGGGVGYIPPGSGYVNHLFDSSVANFKGGYISTTHAHETSIVNVNGGSISNLWGYESAVINIYGGNVGIHEGLRLYGSSVANIYGGNVLFIVASESGEAIINGYNLAISETGGDLFGGYVTGNWADGTPFNISLSDYPSHTYSHIILNEIPEPSTLVLLSVGAISFLRRKIG